jgi:hypothetical protein
MAKYLLNGIEFLGISAELSVTIIREDGLENSEQILREKTETKLIMYDDAYSYLCSIRNNYCEPISIEILHENNNVYEKLFIGTIYNYDISFDINKCIANIDSIKDVSFSALLVLFWDTEIPLYSNKTLNCEDIAFEKSDSLITLGLPPYINDYSLNALDVIRFLVSFISDNKINIVSDYLTTNKIHISTGYSMHNTTGTLDKLYPKVTLKKILSELRKQTTIYSILEVDGLGNTIFRIEDENYSYGSDILLNIPNIPNGFIEKVNNETIYNQIKTGNNTDRTEDITIWQGNRLSSWINDAFVGCGCYGLKDSVLDLATDFVTDGGIIEYVKNIPSGDDSGFEDSIFMYAVTHLAIPSPIQLVDFQISGGIKNTFMWNEEVLKRWVGIANSCIALQRNTKYGFEIIYDANILISASEVGGGIAFTSDINNIVRYQNPPLAPIYDNLNSLYDQPNLPDPFTYFLCQENGDYEFNASGIFFQVGGSTPVLNADLYLSIEAWSGIGGTQIGYQEYVIASANPSANEYLMQLNAQFSLAVGNIVFVRYRMVYTEVGFKKWIVSSKNNLFKLISDSFSCDDLQDELSNFKPFEGEFEYPICFNDYKNLRNNKTGIIVINGKNTWIKEIKYVPNKNSIFKVKYKNTLC